MILPMDELVKMVEEGYESEKMRISAQVEEGFESAKRSMVAKIESYFKGVNPTSRTKMKLEFRKGIAGTILTGEEIKGEGGVPIEVALVDVSAGDIVDSGPEASADVQIVLLKSKPEGDDWTTEEFNADIVPEVEGKQPILSGDVALKLQRGLGVVENIKFRHHASKIKPSQFKLGARIVGDCHIKEAKTEPFILKDFRVKYFEKRQHPSLSDEVSRLVCIGRGGKIDKRLEANKIYTVEDFLIQLLINPQHLKSIVKSQRKKWEAIVNNARACLIGERVYFYRDLKQNTGIIFNILGHVQGLCLGSYYSRTSTLSEEQKDELLRSAYADWQEVRAFDDLNSLQQHLSWLGINMDPSDSQKPDFPHENGKMVAESSSRRSNVSGFSSSSRMDLFTEPEIEIMYEAAMQLQHAWPCSPVYYKGADDQRCGNGTNAGGDRVVCRSNAPKRWRKVLCILRWLMRKRSLSVDDVAPRPCLKKQKLC